MIDPYPFTGVGADFAYGQDQYLAAAKAEAAAAIDAASQRLHHEGIESETRVVESHTVWRGVLEAAETIGADLIVIGRTPPWAGKTGAGQRGAKRAVAHQDHHAGGAGPEAG